MLFRSLREILQALRETRGGTVALTEEQIAATPVGGRRGVLFGDGDAVAAKAGPEGMRFILVAGRPLHEPVAWGGPIVMNTQEELDQAFAEIESGTFIR